MMATRIQIPRNSSQLAIAQSVEFYRIADSFLSKMKGGVDQAGKTAFNNQAQLFSAVTNLALAIELSLKGISIYHNSSVLTTHKLDELFDELNHDVRDEIEAIYESERAGLKPEQVIHLYLTHKSKTNFDDLEQLETHDIYCVLERNNDQFISFRYIFETLSDEGFTRILEFTNLTLIYISTLKYCKKNSIKY